MAKINTSKKVNMHVTHEGSPAKRINSELQLRRTVMAFMLWEDSFYESGEYVADRIKALVQYNKPEVVASVAAEARSKMKLRHVPLLIVREMARHKTHSPLVAKTLEQVIQRADELTEFLAIYWKDGREKLSAQVKKGLAKAFPKFSAYDLAKYNRNDAKIKLRDVLFLCHAKPNDSEQDVTWKKLIDGTLESPDTWEVQLSAGKDKAETFTRLIKEGKLGALALLRNLRNMIDANVEREVILQGLNNAKTDRVLPFRFITAARYAPKFEPELEVLMLKCLEGQDKLSGHTVLLIDVSGSMYSQISNKSEITRIDAACGLAILAREICESVEVFTFSNKVVQVAPRRGFALRDAVNQSQFHYGTDLGGAVEAINQNVKYDRLIVFTDEQSSSQVNNPMNKGYMINVASYENGVGYGKWNHLDGFSEKLIDYIREFEKINND